MTYKQVYTRLNHLNVALSYNGTLKVIEQVSTLHTDPLWEWIASGAPIKFVGDNINKRGVYVASDQSGFNAKYVFHACG